MRQVTRMALLCGAVSLLGMTGMSYGQTVVNGGFTLPADGATGTDSVATNWALNPAVGDDYTNPGARCQFGTTSPAGSSWSLWEQTFVQSGSATQSILSGVTPGNTYTMSADMQFQDGTGPGMGFNAITQANQATDPNTKVTGDCYTYLGMAWLNKFGGVIGTTETTVAAGSVTTYEVGTTGANAWASYSVSGVAPVGAVGVELLLGWQNGGVDANTGGQSVFATDVNLVPEPASLGMLGLGGLAMLARRRARTA
jgi:hypothetical protein